MERIRSVNRVRGKNILWLSFVAILVGTLALVPAGVAPANTKLFIDPTRIPAPGLTGHVGDAYVLTVNVQDVTDLWTIGFRIRFAPYVSVMVISELYEGSFLSEGGFWPTFYTYSIDAFH